MLILIADLGVHFSESSMRQFERSARGERPEVAGSAIPSASPAAAPPSEPGAPSIVVSSGPGGPRDEGPPPASPPSPQPNPSEASPSPAIASGPAPFQGLGEWKRRDCYSRPPPGDWYVAGDAPEDYVLSLGQGPQRIASIEAKGPNPRANVALEHCADVARLVGKRVRFTAQVKAERVRDYANLHLRAWKADRAKIVDQRKSIRDSFGWRTLSVEALIPAEAHAIEFGITSESAGRIWVQRAELTALN